MDNTKEIPKHGHPVDRAFLFSLLHEPDCILLESSREDDENRKNLLFHSPIEVLSTNSLDEIPGIFRTIEGHLSNKRWIAGYIGYECGYHFESVVPSFENHNPLPLIRVGVYDSPFVLGTGLLNSIPPSRTTGILHPHLSVPDKEYHRAFDRLKEYIVNGDTYQVNYTDRFEFEFSGDARELYFDLRRKQHVPFSAYINIGDSQILSFSPELFFRRNGGIITAKPMKGTCRRGRTTREDVELSDWLRNDEKNRSENLMIVDLLRNDIGRICKNGSVSVSEMYAIEKYETVLQMTSTVSGALNEDIGYYDLFKSLFPCGSVTGTPKIRTMQIIDELEQHQRGVYCGAIGFISPDNESVFSVAIRTLELNNGMGTMGIGSGIVFDSDPVKELEECKLKAAFLLNDRPEFQLLETILWKNGFLLLEQHLDRLCDSARYFSYQCRKDTILDALNISTRSFDPQKEYRVRLLLSQNGAPFVEASELSPQQSNGRIRISPERTNSSDTFLYHKTTHRELYDRYHDKAQTEHIADYLFLNEKDEVTEGAVTNLFIEKNGTLYTPPLLCGVLPGIYRNEVLRTNTIAAEKIITTEDLYAADAVFICNSVRGWRKVSLYG